MESLACLGLVLQLLLWVCKGHTAVPYRSRNYLFTQYCKDAQTGRELYVGEVITRPGQCTRVQCLGTLELWEDNCQVPKSLKGDCAPVQPTDLNLDYPKCCPMYECKTYRRNDFSELELTNTYDHYGNLRRSNMAEVIVMNKEPRRLDNQASSQPLREPTGNIDRYI
ncbi:uncharacterized protein LOC115626897 [Scaptodrosophila lebanonensis]|uniref:Uncharacterized protein LOC115626897 n=1 Tax=Drosophila lebanonensis TaxID=7225 RepID=A0A6J2TNR8_DROLE|nr:uncharacterized protein LOC115626897 [Scaptodrosophila lebanonensis]